MRSGAGRTWVMLCKQLMLAAHGDSARLIAAVRKIGRVE